MRKPKCPITNIVCPKNADPNEGTYCPAWWTYAANENGERVVRSECAFQAMKLFLNDAVTAANQSAASANQSRDAILKGLSNVGNAILGVQIHGPAALRQLSSDDSPSRRLSGSEDVRRHTETDS